MSNPYYTPSGVPATSSALSSSAIRAVFSSIESAFDKLPTWAGNGGKLVRVKAAADGLESTDAPVVASLNASGGNLAIGSQSGAGTLDLYEGGVRVGRGHSAGFAVTPGSGADDQQAKLLIENADLTDRALIGYEGSNVLKLRNAVVGANVEMRARNDADNADNLIWDGDPDGNMRMYYAGTLVGLTGSLGLIVRHPTADDPELQLQSSASTLMARLFHTGGTGLILRSMEHGMPVTIDGENGSGDVKVGYKHNPDGNSEVYDKGVLAMRTFNQGAVVLPSSSADDTEVRLLFEQADKTDKAHVGFAGSTALEVHNLVQSGQVHVLTRGSAGVLSNPIIRCGSGALASDTQIGFHNTAPQDKKDVNGSRGSNVALASLCAALAEYGLINNNTTA